ncbi:MAG: serine hydrolase [Streptosporangiales bacterium]|nr:serine hydrolase [Streptosporangiales bacterium]
MRGPHRQNPREHHPGRDASRVSRRTALAAAAVATLTACVPSRATPTPTTAAAPAGGGYGQAQLQRDVDAVGGAGVVGVQGEVVTESGRLLARSGVANLETRDPMPLDGYFRIGSTTKTFVATVMLQLVGEGKLSLEDTVDRWLPGVVEGNGNDGRKITVRHLLQHTSGLDDGLEEQKKLFTSPETWRRERMRTWRPEEVVELATRHEPEFAPGTRWSYSNTNYILAGMIIGKVTGYTWQQEVRRRILTPLGLRHTIAPSTSPDLPDPHAQAYQRFPSHGSWVDVTAFNPSRPGAAGAMISTTGDLNRFFRALVGGALLAPAHLAEMQKTVPAEQLGTGVGYGLGLMFQPLRCGGYWGHGGSVHGYVTRAGVTPDGRRGVAVSATSNSPADPEAGRGASRALDTLVDRALCAAG